MSTWVKIGKWHEAKSRDVTVHTSYAADHIEHETVPGDYDLYCLFEGGYLIPMPYWLIARVDSKVVSGGMYSGFGGVNFAFTPADKGKSYYSTQLYAYMLPELVKNGIAIVDEEWQFLVQDSKEVHKHIRENWIDWNYLSERRIDKDAIWR
jgi:hypothetical protein